MSSGRIDTLSLGTRRIVVIGLILMALTGFGSIRDTTLLLNLDEWEVPRGGLASWGNGEMNVRAIEAMRQALSGMRDSRLVILWIHSVMSGVAFVALARLVRPGGVSRESMRRLASFALLGSAVLRTLDGAQYTVVARRVGEAAGALMAQQPEFQGTGAQSLIVAVFMLFSIGLTVVFGGGAAFLAQYFRSDRVKAQTIALDAADGGA